MAWLSRNFPRCSRQQVSRRGLLRRGLDRIIDAAVAPQDLSIPDALGGSPPLFGAHTKWGEAMRPRTRLSRSVRRKMANKVERGPRILALWQLVCCPRQPKHGTEKILGFGEAFCVPGTRSQLKHGIWRNYRPNYRQDICFDYLF